MTQTTVERVLGLLANHLRRDGYSMTAGVADALGKASEVIAAEIDALTGQRDEATAKAKQLTLKLANARLNLKNCSEEVDKRDTTAEQLAGVQAEIDALTLERDEARAKLDIYSGNAADHEMRVATQIMDGRLRRTQAWLRHKSAKEQQ